MEIDALIVITRGSDNNYFYVDITDASNTFITKDRRFDSLVQASGWAMKQCADRGFEKLGIILDIAIDDE